MNDKVCHIRASVTTGLEFIAAKEAKKKIDVCNIVESRGSITWTQPISTALKAKDLKTIENLEVVMSTFHIDLTNLPKQEAMDKINEYILDIDWSTGLEVWSQYSGFKHPIKLPSTSATDGQVPECLPSYRATCYRSGKHHSFTSIDCLYFIGGKIYELSGWKLDLKNFDIEVIIHIKDDDVTFSLALTPVSLYKRNITHFSKTTLKATICAALLSLAKIKPGDVVVDPMCGSGSITVEGALEYPYAFHVGGDNQEYCVQTSIDNITDMNKRLTELNQPPLNAASILWDATNMPLVTASVDVIVTDLPFGKRVGSKIDNRKLYPSFLTEAARVSVPHKGRAVILTSDVKCMDHVLKTVQQWWLVPRISFINHGGLVACLYFLKRTARYW